MSIVCGRALTNVAPGVYNIAMTHLGNDWDQRLAAETSSEYMAKLRDFLREEYRNGRVYPPMKEILAAFEYSSYDDTEVVILGQDPYHGAGQANGLCFSVGEGGRVSSVARQHLQGAAIRPRDRADELRRSARLGETGRAAAQQRADGARRQTAKPCRQGLERFTDAVVAMLAARQKPLVFMLWGGYAKRKGAMIDKSRHLVLESVHPSPLSFYQGFLECRHFSKANAFLIAHGMRPIDWSKRSLAEYEAAKRQG